MRTTATSKLATPEIYLGELRAPTAKKRHLWVLNGFQRFAAEQAEDKSVSQETLRLWLNDRVRFWPMKKLAQRARMVDCFLDWMVNHDALSNNPFADLRKEYGQRRTAPVVRALLAPDCRAALEALRRRRASAVFSVQ
jgi:hypothetical protein